MYKQGLYQVTDIFINEIPHNLYHVVKAKADPTEENTTCQENLEKKRAEEIEGPE
jgi:hypothetical protein